MKTKSKWSKKWPKKEGKYFFFGYPFGRETHFDGTQRPPELNYVRVSECSNGFLYAREGSLWFEGEGGRGLFLKIDEPILPDISELPELPLTNSK